MSQKNDYAMTQAEVGHALGITRGMVHHIENAALEKIKRELERRGIQAFDLFEVKDERK